MAFTPEPSREDLTVPKLTARLRRGVNGVGPEPSRLRRRKPAAPASSTPAKAAAARRWLARELEDENG
jgi:hypothetical protein